MSAHGGDRPGAGRPRGDRAPAATGYRPRARDIERAAARGLTLSQLIDEGLDATAAAEDADPGGGPLVTIQAALRASR